MDENREIEASADEEIDQLFDLGAQLYSTRTSEAVQAVVKSTRDPVLLWLLRYPLDSASVVVSRFIRRLDQVKAINTSVPRFRNYGVDPSGMAYLAMESLDGERLIEKSWAPRDAEQYFLNAVQTVADLHVQKVLVGDICEDSFLVDDSGRIYLIALMGTYEVEAKRTAALPAVHTLPFISPEQRSGTGSDFASDVYALGILGYRLFTGRYPSIERSSGGEVVDPIHGAAPPSTLRASLPTWVDDILGQCLEVEIEKRYGNAAQLRAVLDEAVRTGRTPGGTGRWSQRGLIVRPSTESVPVGDKSVVARDSQTPVRSKAHDVGPAVREGKRTEHIDEETATEIRRKMAARASATTREEEIPSPRRRSPAKLLGVTVVLTMLVLALVFIAIKAGAPKVEETRTDAQELLDLAPPELKPAVSDLLAGGISQEQRKRALLKIIKSEDPNSFTILYSILRLVTDEEIRAIGRKSLLLRLDRAGLTESSKILEAWFGSVEKINVDPTLTPIFPHILRACDRSQAIKSRQSSLVKVFQKNKDIALQLAAALAIDTMVGGEFVPSLRKLLELSGVTENLDEKGVGPLILSHRGLSIVFEPRLTQLLPQFSAADLELALKSLADGDSAILPDVAREALRREIVPPFQQIFLRSLVTADRFRTTRGVKRSLVDAARGVVTRADLENLAHWEDANLSAVLLGVAAIATDPRVASAAIETLVARSLGNEPARSLLTWVKVSLWDYREKVAKAIGILGTVNVAKPEEVDYAFDQLMPFTGRGSLLKAVLSGGDPRLIAKTIERTGEITSSSDLLALLTPSNDPVVRVAAVRALRGRNDVSVLHAVLKAYDKETDEEVRDVYREVHWVIQNRGSVPPATN